MVNEGCHIALVTDSQSICNDYEMDGLVDSLLNAGATPDIVSWEDPAVFWGSYDMALIRSPWSYTKRPQAFDRWLSIVEHQVTVLNPPSAIRWNRDKRYLLDMQQHGIRCIPTVFVESRDDLQKVHGFIQKWRHEFSRFVVKPAIGAYSRGVKSFDTEELQSQILDRNSSDIWSEPFLLQPYIESIDTYGEMDIVCFNAEISHYVAKDPLLRSRSAALEPTQERRRLGVTPLTEPALNMIHDVNEAAQKLLKLEDPLLYSRIDLVPDGNGSYFLLEYEIFEPSLSLNLHPTSFTIFTRNILERLR